MAGRSEMGLKPADLAQALRIGLKSALLAVGFPTRSLRSVDQSLILFYHAISDDDVSASAFEQQVRYLKRHVELVFASEIDTPSPEGRLRVAITFDDGLKNTRDVALPILEKLGVKATLFVLPGDLSWLWTAEMRERLEGAMAAGTVIDGCPPLGDRRDIDQLVEDMKTMPHDAFIATLERIRAATSFAPSPAWRAEHELMDDKELGTLSPDLVEIGAHTLTHPILTQVDDDRLEKEIVESKRRLEAVLQRPVTTLSYPNGNFDQRCLEIAGRHFDYAFTTETAIDEVEDRQALKNHPHAINRLHGVAHLADLPLRMLRFLRAGHGFSARPAAEPTIETLPPDPKETPGYEIPAVMRK